MPRRAIPLVSGDHYHVYNRGHNGQAIFSERENYLFFLHRVREYLMGGGKASSASSERKDLTSETRLP